MKCFYLAVMAPLILLASTLSSTDAVAQYRAYSLQECTTKCAPGMQYCMTNPENRRYYVRGGMQSALISFCRDQKRICISHCYGMGKPHQQ